MTIDEDGLLFLQEREACSLVAYLDEANVWTIGWGSTRYENGERVHSGDVITQNRADILLIHECNGIVDRIENLVKVQLNQNQINALCSFVYNIGLQAFRTSTLLRFINDGIGKRSSLIESNFLRWNKIHKDGKLIQSKGLKARRQMEYALYIKD